MMRRPGTLSDAPVEKARDRAQTARRLLSEFIPYRSSLLVVLALIVVSALSQAVGPWLISQAIDIDISHGDRGGLARTMLALLVVYVIGAFAQRGQVFGIGSVGQRVLAALRERLFVQFQRLPLSYFDTHPVGDLMSRVLNDVDTINQLVSQGLAQGLGSLFALVGILVAMLVLDPPLALVSFTIIPVMIVTTVFFSRRARVAYRLTRETVGDVTAELQEELVGVRQAQAFNRTESNIARFRQSNQANRDANVAAVGITSAFAPTIDVLSTLATALVIGFGGYLVFNRGLSVGKLAAFLIYIQQFFRPIQLIAQIYTQLQSSLAGGERIFGILDQAQEPPDAAEATTLPAVKGQITFSNVSFGYDPARPVLHDVDFTIEPGQTLALVGQTGAGKTTISNLIPRFYDVTAGQVLVDGHDVRSVTRASLRGQIAMVLQEPFLFTGTVAENIGYGRADATRSEIEAAARASDADGFIQDLPGGYDSVLGEGGVTLSQGQRQLLSFARAVLADPRILILDEATSNIDTRTEATIQKALATLLAGRTSVVIAHRLSTIQNADVILVVQAGRIAERGTHHELLAKSGLYADLYHRQFRDTAVTQPV